MAEQDCQKCKRYKGCPGHDWYHFGEIRWCPQQVIWLWQNRETLRAGVWVDRHEESGESRQLKAEAYFVQAVLVITELDMRLDKTPNKGELLTTQIEDERDFETLSPGARQILMYVKGRKPKRIGFNRWQREVYGVEKTGEI